MTSKNEKVSMAATTETAAVTLPIQSSKLGDTTMKTLAQAIATVNNYATQGAISENTRHNSLTREEKMAIATALKEAYKLRARKGWANSAAQSSADCPYQLVKSAVYRVLNNSLRTEYESILFEGLTDDDIVELYMNDEMPAGFDAAFDYAQTECEKLEWFYTQLSAVIYGRNPGEFALNAPTIRYQLYPDHTGDAPRVDVGQIGSKEDIDPAGITQPRVWSIVKDQLNGVINTPKGSAIKAWRRLNAEISQNQHAFNPEVVTEEVLLGGTRYQVRTQGWATYSTEWLERTIWQQENPVEWDAEGRVMTAQPYAYDVRDLGDSLKAYREREANIEVQIAVRDALEPIITKLASGISFSDVRRADEARKAQKVDIDAVWFVGPKELCSQAFEITEFVEDKESGVPVPVARTIYAETFNRHDIEAINTFLSARALHNSKERLVDQEKEREIYSARALEQLLEM
ncbi:hypothetical protein HPC37_02860 [Pasteurellaceae bacterium 20609_3]|uniref:hypothetical protein n=1 Tax=Spirabiliibacterium mucosae TaxID=28156 RepID=UPI001AACC895|nr:hypothetical protein [Spirabiliibacterium mucosae]MBE2897795.1 hypothetical protein [Spirabiliibacterium mucosae]